LQKGKKQPKYEREWQPSAQADVAMEIDKPMLTVFIFKSSEEIKF
jgi:hypothetical protein